MNNYKDLAKQARTLILTMIYRAQTSHIGSNFSIVDFAVALYVRIKIETDRVVWSKGWAAATIYYFLYVKGILSVEELLAFPNEPFYGLAETSVKGVEVSGGAMGHGLPVALGIAFGKKKAGEQGKVYCIMSDGEMQEGTTWECAISAAQHKLDNLIVVIDHNGWCAMGQISEVAGLEPFSDKWRAFGWDVTRIDGHNFEHIETALNHKSNKPTVIILDTVKGKGVSFMENHLLYHYKQLSKDEYDKAFAEINR